MLLLGIDLGTSSIKVSVMDANSRKCIVTVQHPETETAIKSLKKGWAEQSPDLWWQHIQEAILKAHSTKKYYPKDIVAIGIAYQMHGLVLVNKEQQVLRDSIIWCDSRAVEIGNNAFNGIGKDRCLEHLLNSPGNFSAAKLSWVKDNEPEIYSKIDKILLPGDFISMKFTGNITTSKSALSEGIFWDFKKNELSEDVLNYFGFNKEIFPTIQDVFSIHGNLKNSVAETLHLRTGIPVSYKAGDQPNNALALNVFEPGEVASTAGTSGVIYGVSDKVIYDKQSRVNTFAHVNHIDTQTRLGTLLCINGTGIMNSWVKKMFGTNISYNQMNNDASGVNEGSDGLKILPFGNGAERMLNNKTIAAHIQQIDLNKHTAAHIFRATQEGIAFAFRYGLDIMRSNGIHPEIIRAGKANMFYSEIFTESFVNATNVPVALYNCDGSSGAALGAGIGSGYFKNAKDAFSTGFVHLKYIVPSKASIYEELYQEWKCLLEQQLNKIN